MKKSQLSLRYPAGRACSFLGWCAAVLAAIPLLFLCAASLWRSAEFDHNTFLEALSLAPQRWYLSLAAALALGAVLAVAGRVFGCGGRRAANTATAVAAAMVASLGAAYVLSLHSHPVNDQAEVWKMALALADGNTGRLDMDYLQMYPYQSGMALLYEPLVWLFGPDPYPAVGLFNALCAGTCVPALCGICRAIGGSHRAVVLCALLCLLFLPLPMMSSFLYGTIPALAMALWALRGALQLCRGGARAWWLALLLLLPAVVLYSEMQIFSIAALGILLLHGLLGGGGWRRALAAVLLLVACLNIGQAAQWVFAWRTGITLGEGIPKIAWVVMGLTATDTNSAAGGYNSYTKALYWANGGDTAATTAAALAELRAWLVQSPAQCGARLAFFYEKILTEWLDPWFTALTVTYQPEVDTPGAFAALFCGGALLEPLTALLRTLRTLVYGAAAGGCVLAARRSGGAVWAQGAGIAFFGCFLFQLAWENHSRYCMPYFLCLLPLAALALARLGGRESGPRNK